MIHDTRHLRESSSGELRGFTFMVLGRRGSAKKHYGKHGVCKWVGRVEDGKVRVGLAVDGEEKLAYCAFSQLERVPMKSESLHADAVRRTEQRLVRDAVATLRPKLEVALRRRGRKPTAYVVSGRDAGKHGEVFWTGPDKKTGEQNVRLGIRTASGEVVWASAYDCAAQPMAEVTPAERAELERVAADLAMEGRHDDARTVLQELRRPLPVV